MNKFKLSQIILYVISIGLLLNMSMPAYSSSKNFQSPYFSMSIPQQMKKVSENNDAKINLHRYVFRSMPNNDYSKLQIRVTAVKIPKHINDYTKFEMDTLGFYLANFMDSYKLYRYLREPSIKKELSKKFSTINIGNQIFMPISMTFDSIETKFLVTRDNNMAYIFTLISIDKNKTVRRNNMDMLLSNIKTVKYHGIAKK